MEWLLVIGVVAGCALGLAIAVAFALLVFDVNPPAVDRPPEG